MKTLLGLVPEIVVAGLLLAGIVFGAALLMAVL